MRKEVRGKKKGGAEEARVLVDMERLLTGAQYSDSDERLLECRYV